jgi:hypothetical protein
MSMLARYKKPGGFVQLVKLIEGFGPKKRKKFLEMIEDESEVWAEAVKDKILTIDRIMNWDEQVVAEIVNRLSDLNIATAMLAMTEDQRNKILKFLSHGQKRRLDEIKDMSQPSESEINTVLFKIVAEVREMSAHGYIRIDKVDPSLKVEDEIEETLNAKCANSTENLHFDMVTSSEEKAKAAGGDEIAAEVIRLKQRIQAMNKQNVALKEEVQDLKVTLRKIQKLAS